MTKKKVEKKEKLRSCPFCKETKVIFSYFGEDQWSFIYYIYCPTCRARGPLASDEEKAVRWWQERGKK